MARKPPDAKIDVQALLERMAALEERIRRLEGDHDRAVGAAADFGVVSATSATDARPDRPASAPASAPTASLTPPASEVPEEVLFVISAAVAAFLGERAHVRQVRMIRSDAWAQQGRVSVMASHRWAVHR